MTSNSEQLTFENSQPEANNTPIVCLGMTFENEVERRNYFREELRKKLPELKKIEGFPIGEDKDIITLSDPPYYTACPNPWISDFIEEWEKEKAIKYGRYLDEEYNREPFAADVSEGKNDPIYNAHSYHTKVPHKAIIHYLLHYTNPGDIIYDGFCGTGMTAVAAYEIGNPTALKEMKLQVSEHDGHVYDSDGEFIGEFGKRKAIINDLSPAASSISANYVKPHNAERFVFQAEAILGKIETELGWMYQTKHILSDAVQKDTNGNEIQGNINYSVWSDVLNCPHCSEELVYFDVAVNLENNKFKDKFECPNCKVFLKKTDLDKTWETKYDSLRECSVEQVKQVPVLINYSVGSKRFEKKPSDTDIEIIKKIEDLKIPNWVPIKELPFGQNTEQPKKSHGFTHIHDLYSKRNLIVLSLVYSEVLKQDNSLLLSWLTSSMTRTTKMYKFTLDRKMGTVSGTYYIPSLWTENTPFKLLKRKMRDFSKVRFNESHSNIINCGSQTKMSMNENSIDYIFTDPPFGGNLMYSELNFLWEAWFNVQTNNSEEAIVNATQRKGLTEYQDLMESSFVNYIVLSN